MRSRSRARRATRATAGPPCGCPSRRQAAPLGRAWGVRQRPAHLGQRPVGLGVVAAPAGRDDVVPGVGAAPAARARRGRCSSAERAAVDAGLPVAGEDGAPRQRHRRRVGHPHVPGQPHDDRAPPGSPARRGPRRRPRRPARPCRARTSTMARRLDTTQQGLERGVQQQRGARWCRARAWAGADVNGVAARTWMARCRRPGRGARHGSPPDAPDRRGPRRPAGSPPFRPGYPPAAAPGHGRRCTSATSGRRSAPSSITVGPMRHPVRSPGSTSSTTSTATRVADP